MSFKPFFRMLKHDQLAAFTGINALFKPFYKLSYLAAAKNGGLFDLLSGQAAPFDRLAQTYCRDAKAREALQAWLQLGVRLGVLSLGPDGYALKGLAKKLSLPHNDAALALLQEVAGLHYRLIVDTPGKLRKGELWGLEDQDGELISRSSRALEAFQVQAIDEFFPASGAVRLLEIGCGSAFYIQHAAARNPALTALGLELQPDVATLASRNIVQWRLQDRIRIEAGDIRAQTPDALFDIATLYNNIYYFPVEDRIALLRHVRQFLESDGFLLLTTCCQGGNLGIEVLNLWGAATASGGRLPSVDEMIEQLNAAGYRKVQAISLIPGDKFFAFRAQAGTAAAKA